MGKYKSANCKCNCIDCEKCEDCGQKCCNRIKIPSDRRRGRTTMDMIARGPRGQVGPIGPPGAMGVPGTPGVRGSTGPAGSTGPIGPVGPMGLPGIGATGAPGVTGDRGPTGLRGATGIAGPTGPTGVFEDDICDLFDETYNECSRTFDFTDPACPTPSNFTMFSGCTINPGGVDEQDFDFSPLLSTSELNDFLLDNFGIYQVGPDTWRVGLPSTVTNFSIKTPALGTPLMTTSVTETVFDILVCGQSGPGRIACSDFFSNITAPTGARGPTGLQGMTGAQGMDGAAAFMGDTGAQGVQGPTGLQGSTGAQGLPGMAAFMGDTGVQGATGLQGDLGVTGPQGFQGFQGFQGITGPTGMNNMVRCGPLLMGNTAANDFEKSMLTGMTVGELCLNLSTGTLDEWDGATWQIVNPQPDRPYFYFDTMSTLIYELTGTIGAPALLQFKPGDLVLTEDGSGHIFISGQTGWGMCDLNGDLCQRLDDVQLTCIGDVSITGATGKDYLCFVPDGTAGTWINSPITLTVESATTPTGAASTSTSINLPDTLRFFSQGGLISITTPGSAVVQLEPANLIQNTGDPTLTLPSGPTDPSRPVLYANTTTGQLFWWDPAGANWQVIVPELNNIGDVDTSGATEGHYLCFTGGQWVSSPIMVQDLWDTSVTGATAGDYLCYDASTNQWINSPIKLDDLCDTEVASAQDGEYLCFTGGKWISNKILLDHLGDVTVTGAATGHYLQYDGSQWINGPPRIGNEIRCGGFLEGMVSSDAGSKAPAASVPEGTYCLTLNTGTLFVRNAAVMWELIEPQPDRPYFYLDTATGEMYQLDMPGPTGPPSLIDPEHGDTIFTNSGPENTYVYGPGGWEICGNLCNKLASVSIDCLGDVQVTGPSPGDVLQYTGGQWVNGPIDFKLGANNILLNDLGDVTTMGPTAGNYLCFNGTEWVNSPVSVSDLDDTEISGPVDGEYLCFTGGKWINAPVGRANLNRCGDLLEGLTAPDAGSKPLIGPFQIGDLCLTTNTGTLFEWDGATWQIVNPQPHRPFFYLDTETNELYDIQPPGPTGPAPTVVDAQEGDLLFTTNGTNTTLILGPSGWAPCGDLCTQLGAVQLDCLGDVNATGATGDSYLRFDQATNQWIASPVSLTVEAAPDAMSAATSSTTINLPDTIRFISDGGIISVISAGSSIVKLDPANILSGPTDASIAFPSGPPDTTRPAIYVNTMTNQLFNWNPSSLSWNVIVQTLDQIGNVDATGATGGQYLCFDGTNWINADISLNDLIDVDVTNFVDGQCLCASGGTWVPTFIPERIGNTIRCGGFETGISAENAAEKASVIGSTGLQCLDRQTGALFVWDGSTWELIVPQPTRPYFYLDTSTNEFYNIVGASGPAVPYGTTEGDMFLEEGTSGNIWIRGPTGFMICDRDLCNRLGVLSIDCLGDVNTPNPNDGEYFCFTGGEWISKTISLEELADIDLSGATSGDYLCFNGTGWTNSPIPLDNLEDTDVAGATMGEYLCYDGTNWINKIININDLGDVVVPAPNDGEYLCFTGGEWISSILNLTNNTINDLGDVMISGATAGEYLCFNGTDWTNSPIPLDNLEDTDVAGATMGEYLCYDGTNWINKIININDLGDVVVPAPNDGEYLCFTGGEWISQEIDIAGALNELSITNLGDVNIFGPTTGEYLCFSGGEWINSIINLNDLGDVEVPTPVDGEYLCFTGGKWVNQEIDFKQILNTLSINDLGDVNVFGATSGDCLCFTGGEWVGVPSSAIQGAQGATGPPGPPGSGTGAAIITGPPYEVIAINDAGTMAIAGQDQVLMTSIGSTVSSGTQVASISSSTSDVQGTRNTIISAENSNILDGVTNATGVNGAGDEIMITGAGIAENTVILGGANLKAIHRNSVVTGEDYQSHEDNSFNIGGKLYIKDVSPLTIATGATALPFTIVQVLNDLGDVDVPSPMNGECLCFTGGVWVGVPLSDIGAQGFQGFQGATGAQGMNGTAAMMGDTGAQGFQGFQGFQGATGAQGMNGGAAMMGDTGAQGAMGFHGATGAQGLGATGAQGAPGGGTGAQGSVGPTGPPGSLITGPPYEVIAINDAGTMAIAGQDQVLMTSIGSTVSSGTQVAAISSSTSDVQGTRSTIISAQNSNILDGVTSTTGINGAGNEIMITGAGVAENTVILGGSNLKAIHRNSVVTGEDYQTHEDNSFKIGGKLYIKDIEVFNLGTGSTALPFTPVQFLNDLIDVDVPLPADGECLCFTGGVWVATTIQPNISGPPYEVIAINDAGTMAISGQDQVLMTSSGSTVSAGTQVAAISSSTSNVQGTRSTIISAQNSNILDGVTSATGINGAGNEIMITGAGVAENTVILGGANLKAIHRNAVVTGENYQSHEDNSFNIGGKLYIKDLESLTLMTGATAAPFTINVWQPFTTVFHGTTTDPTKGTITTDVGSFSVTGDTMEIKMIFEQSAGGTIGSGIYSLEIPFPGVYNIDLASAPTLTAVGTGEVADPAGTGAIRMALIRVLDATNFQAYTSDPGAPPFDLLAWSSGFGPANFASTNLRISWTITVPIVRL